MVDQEEIRRWIARLECEGASWGNYEKLAVLYAMQNRAQQSERPTATPILYSAAAAPVESITVRGEGEFYDLIYQKNLSQVLEILNDLMQTLEICNPRVYNSIARRLREI